MKLLSVFLWVLLVSVSGGRQESRALVVFPGPAKSHGILGHSIVRILLEAGYEVTYVTHFPSKTKMPELIQIDVSSVLYDAKGKELLHEANVEGPRTQHVAVRSGFYLTKLALQHPEFHALLMDGNLTFDVVIAQWLNTGLLAPLAVVFDCPLIWYTASSISWEALELVHEASSPTYSFDALSGRVPRLPLSIAERLYQTWRQYYGYLVNKYHTSSIEIPAYKDIYLKSLEKQEKELPTYESLVYNGSLVLLDSHPLLSQNLPVPHNMKYIGGHHIGSNVSTPKNFQKLLDESKNGVIFVNLGDDVNIPEYFKRELVEVFGQLEQTVIWKLSGRLWNTPSNVHIVAAISQRLLLSHSNMFSFITSGDPLALMDALHFGVPVIAIPTFVEQYASILDVVDLGAGILVDYNSNFPWKLKEAVNELLGNFRINAKTASWLFRSRPLPPKLELLHWVNLVKETRGAVHLRSPALQVTSVERYYVDIVILTMMFVWFLSKVLKVIQAHAYDVDKKNM